ncbi:hypothetical protein CCACVL1_03664 [Corchorus capsularis]|uniref:Leucine-rich repeat-containing N-terminal plant-type domain-containing protein n=1 Tax=Corchorus capsularis TaxID=210143 RepID=A0A1R3JXX6_COCAP|nr:hypothetical protein CCACVL1_03664 [Corchorus capsularis]
MAITSLIPSQFLFFLMLVLFQFPNIIISTSSAVGVAKEAETLVKWKGSLDNNSQTLLSSWGAGGSPCNWLGITCNNGGSITNLSLAHYGLRGT